MQRVLVLEQGVLKAYLQRPQHGLLNGCMCMYVRVHACEVRGMDARRTAEPLT